MGNETSKAVNLLNKSTRSFDLDLEDHGLKDKDVIKIADALHKNKTCAALKLQKNYFSVAGCKAISEALCVNRNLKRLYLGYSNSINDACISALSDGISRSTILGVLDLSGTKLTGEGLKILGEALQSNRSIHSINLSDIRFDGVDITLFADLLKKKEGLKVLELSNCNFGDKGAQGISDYLKSPTATVEQLNLCKDKITEFGATKLAESLEVNTTLISLQIFYNGIGTNGAKSFLQCLKVNQTLKRIEINDETIQNEWIEEINSILAVRARANK